MSIVQRNKTWEDSFLNVKRWLFYFVTILFVSGNILDIFNLELNDQNPIFYINLIFILSLSVVFGLYFLRTFDFYTLRFIVLYLIFINIFLSQFLTVHFPNYDKFFLRETIIVGVLLPAFGFLLRKLHVALAGLIYLVLFFYSVIFAESSFLKDNIIVLLIIVINYIVWMYYIFHFIEKMYLKHVELIHKLEGQNRELDIQRTNYLYANQTKDKFLSIIAHDLKTPFTSLIGFSELLVKYDQAGDYSKIGRISKLVNSSARQAFNLLVNIMDWSKSQEGKIHFEPEWFNIDEVVQRTVDLFKLYIEQKEIKMTISIQSQLDIYADKNMLTTIVRNLISNAIKYSHQGGEIIFSAISQKDAVKFSVSDEGIGMTEDEISKLYSIDKNFSKPGTNNEQGTGLGLILCKDFVEYHKGRLWTKSEPDKGSVFYFTIPQNGINNH